MQVTELFEHQTWELARIAVQRLSKDRRARREIGSLLLASAVVATIPLVVVAFVFMAVLVPQLLLQSGSIFGLFIFIAILVVTLETQKSARLEKASRPLPDAICRDIAWTTYWLAMMLRRCGSEVALLKEIPPEIEIVTRRVLLDKLAAMPVWAQTPQPVRDLLLKADGHWTEQERKFVLERFEYLSVLRWLLSVDVPLRTLILHPKYAFGQAHEVTEDATWMAKCTVRPAFQIITKHNQAALYLERCWAEGILRGNVQADEAAKAKVAGYMQRFEKDCSSKDFLFGERSIGQLTGDELAAAYWRAARRTRLLRLVLENGGVGATATNLANLILEGYAFHPTEQ